MKKFGIQIVILVLIIVGALYYSFNGSNLKSIFPVGSSVSQTQIKIDDNLVNIEVADTADKRSKGLSGRDNLASNSGMLFIFPEVKKYQFWMKGMKFTLDLIFIKNGKIIDILKSASPPDLSQQDSTLPIYEPTESVDMMLEVNGGFSDLHSIKTGDQVYLVK